MPEKEPTQRTGQGHEIPVPKRGSGDHIRLGTKAHLVGDVAFCPVPETVARSEVSGADWSSPPGFDVVIFA